MPGASLSDRHAGHEQPARAQHAARLPPPAVGSARDEVRGEVLGGHHRSLGVTVLRGSTGPQGKPVDNGIGAGSAGPHQSVSTASSSPSVGSRSLAHAT